MNYPIVQVPSYDQIEPRGNKKKFWYRGADRRDWMFKIGRVGTGENWAEKMTCELARLMKLPCAHYEFAAWGHEEGVTTPIFVPEGGRLVFGNELLAKLNPSYPQTQSYKLVAYELRTVLGIMRMPQLLPPLADGYDVSGLSALDVFVGYLIFDCWVGNPDRHHENWGWVVSSAGKIHLAPTYDHASGLGVRLSDDDREKRLMTRDSGYTVSAYVEKAVTPFYDASGRKMKTLDVVEAAYRTAPDAVKMWRSRIVGINRSDLESVFSLVPEAMISKLEIAFALTMLEENKNRLERIS